MKTTLSITIAIIALISTTAPRPMAEQPVAGFGALIGSRYFDSGSPAPLTLRLGGDAVAPTQPEPGDRVGNLGLRRSALGQDADAARTGDHSPCRQGDRGRLIHYERVASHPTPASVRDYFDEWIAFYQDFYQFPSNIPVTFIYGFDSYKVTYCTVD